MPSLYSVIVCYNPDWLNIFKLTATLKASGVKSIIIDNSDNAAQLKSKIDFEYIPLHSNFGIAEAQNKGIELALGYGAQSIIFFDQDSTIENDFIQKLASPILNDGENIVAPIFKSIKHGFFYKIVRCLPNGKIKKITPEVGSNFYTNIVISSGTMVKSSVFKKVGLMKTEFFIDYVDTEWCLRANGFGFNIYVNTCAVMQHEIGDKTISLGKFNVPVHSAYRRYYRIRNSFHLFRLEHIPKKLAIREIIFSLLHQILLILLCGNKTSYIKSLLYGVKDGFSGRLGRWDL